MEFGGGALRGRVRRGGGVWRGFHEFTVVLLLFFSSRRRHTRLQGDWSSDVCSSDLVAKNAAAESDQPRERNARASLYVAGIAITDRIAIRIRPRRYGSDAAARCSAIGRSGERRVGEEGRYRWAPHH